MAPFDAKLLFILHFISSTLSAPQHPEINDQFTTKVTATMENRTTDEVSNDETTIYIKTTTEANDKQENTNNETSENKKYIAIHTQIIVDPKPNFLDTIYEMLTKPITDFLSSPKVNLVLRNVGTCIVNGVMEIISYYFPPPLIPLIASAAGMVIPFEPVVMLKEKMPVTSYRRAFKKAMNSFLNTFDTYKLDTFDDDPYMTRRFNRRFMNDLSEEEKKKSKHI